MEIIPNISIDCVLFAFDEEALKLLLIKRDKEPRKGKWALPGGYVGLSEAIDHAASRILGELTGVHNLFLSQVGLFGDPDRYPTHRVISMMYCALVAAEDLELLAGSYASEVRWFLLDEIGELPFDHSSMVQLALNWLKDHSWDKEVLQNLLPEKFPLNQMQTLIESILQQEMDNRNFRKKMMNADWVERLDEKTSGGKQRPAYLFRMKSEE